MSAAQGPTGEFGASIVESGPWAGWSAWSGVDPFEDNAAAFYFRRDPGGAIRCALRCEHKQLNGAGFMHGGAIMTFADYSLFAVAQDELAGGRGVTVTLNGEFVGAAKEGDLVESTGEVIRAGRSLIFIRGLIVVGAEPIMSYSGVIKRMNGSRA